MSKNPPLTEDQIRQSAEAEARHAATQAPRPSGLHDRAAEGSSRSPPRSRRSSAPRRTASRPQRARSRTQLTAPSTGKIVRPARSASRSASS